MGPAYAIRPTNLREARIDCARPWRVVRNMVSRVRPPICCVKYGPSNRLAARIEIAGNDFTQEIAEKAGIGDFRMKSCPNEAFSGVVGVSFRRAAAAIPWLAKTLGFARLRP